MTQPIIHDYLTQIFCKHYKMEPKDAAEAGLKFLDILELYDMQLIIGKWEIPEAATPLSPWEIMLQTTQDTMEREPWLAKEIQ